MATVFFYSSNPNAANIVESLRRRFPDHEWVYPATDAERKALEARAPDLVISFLNAYIVPPAILAAAKGHAFNIHPASPDFPGRDPQHFAFYEGSAVAAATLHRMEPSVDSGEIIDVLEAPIDRARGVMHYIAETERLSLALLDKHVPAMLAATIAAGVPRSWRASAKRTRKHFLEMCRLDPSMSKEEVLRRIEAFGNPDYRNLYVEIHGIRFYCDPPKRG